MTRTMRGILAALWAFALALVLAAIWSAGTILEAVQFRVLATGGFLALFVIAAWVMFR